MKLKDIKNWNAELDQSIKLDKEKFNFKKNSKKIYSIDTPPPYVNTPVHIGQSVTYAYMDFFARYKRMKGFEVIFPLGLDRNGLPIEMAAEKKFKISPFHSTRKEFINACKKILEETSSETADTFEKLGISFTSYKEGNHIGAVYKTDSPEYRLLTQSTFLDLYRKQLVYEDTRVNNWDPKLQTTIADSEIEYKEIPSTFNDVIWEVKETKEKIVIATTRPELIGTCSAVIFNPKDERYKKLKGKHAVIPLYGREVPIMPHPFADPKKGTGIVMMCAGGDLTDIQFVREQKLTPIIWVGKDGKMIEESDMLKGLKVREAREKMIELLKAKNLIKKQEQIIHRTPISDRSKAEIEFIEMPEFYLKQIQFKKDMKKISKELNWHPKEAKKILDNWIDSVSIDWPISRRRFYATPIPLWHSNDLTAVPKGGEYYEPYSEKPPKDSEIYKNGKKIGKIKDYKDEKWAGEIRVFDTWMDSSISELHMLRYKSDNDFFKKAYPASLRPQGKEIVRTWLYYTLLRGYLETGKKSFENVWIHQHIVDSKGRKMSKSLGNVVDPQKLLKDYGGEAIRFWAATEGDLSKQDLKASEEKIRAELKTLTKMINVAKFINMFKFPKTKPKLTETDEIFLEHMDHLITETDEDYSKYDFHHPALKLREFIWEIFASHYIELVKNRAYNEEKQFTENESNSAKYTLHQLFKTFLTLAHPIIPKITSLIAKEGKIELDKEPFPKPTKKSSNNVNLIKEKLMPFNQKVWKMKKEKGISLRDEIKGIKIPKELKPFEKDLKACHKI